MCDKIVSLLTTTAVIETISENEQVRHCSWRHIKLRWIDAADNVLPWTRTKYGAWMVAAISIQPSKTIFRIIYVMSLML